jgi:hypothetical protein
MNRISNWLKNIFHLTRYSKSRTVKTMFSFSLLSVLILLGAANVITSREVSYIKLVADKDVIQAGDRFSLDIYAFAHVPVNAVDVTLRFEEGTVDVLGVDRGQSVLTIWTEDPIVEKDRITLRGGTFRNGFVGEHKIATVDLKANQTGESEFFAANVTLLAGDGRGTPVTVAESNNSTLSLYIYDENETPENIGIDVAVSIVTDIDGDGNVSLKDVSSFMGAWSSQNRIYDFNGDGKMSFKDFSIILSDAFLGT